MSHLTDLTSSCIRCGFCLESCPTFLLTGQETESPRGRIYLIRSAEEGKVQWADIKPHMDKCLGCRGCETACPSGVKYGEIFELARDRLEREMPNFIKKTMIGTMTQPGVFRLQQKLGTVPAMLLSPIQNEKGAVRLPQTQPDNFSTLADLNHIPVKGEVYLLEGCVMKVLFPGVHTATRRLLRRLGFVVKPSDAGCCGALHAHNGLLGEAHKMAVELAKSMPGDTPVIVNSAGCGSTMKEYEDRAFAGRVKDISEFLLENGLSDLLNGATLNTKLTYHDACHLAHGQKVTQPPRQLLKAIPGIQWVDLKESDLCCGSAGIYNATQPQTARALRDRKWANIQATGAEIVVLGNPGCHAWLIQAAQDAQSPVRVMHTAEVLELALAAGRSN